MVAGGPRVADVLHGATAAVTGAAVAAAGGGVLVIIGTVLAAIAVPAFVRYRVTRVAVYRRVGHVSGNGPRLRSPRERAEVGAGRHRRRGDREVDDR